jgi:hypothetical protein
MIPNLQVRRNINTLEYPIWSPSSNLAKLGEINTNKYLLECSIGLPTSKDIDILNHLLAKAQLGDSNVLEYKSIYSLIKELGLTPSTKEYKRIKKGINRWHRSYINYKNNSFYIAPGKYRSNPHISIIKNTSEEPLTIVFNETFIDLNNEKYSLLLSSNFIRSLEKPYAKRLYEILVKSFRGNNEFSISTEKLMEKIPIKTFRNRIYRITNSSIQYLNQKAFDGI